MKRTALLLGALCTLLIVSCGKAKHCRCSVLGEQEVRVIDLEKGDCNDVRFVYYNQDALHMAQVDSVLCTDYDFEKND
ncbi:MAG: hypothetical protein IJ684_05705 [Bacteroidales bacterium]|nr:hypothetical protein [Bacteroidales bacterium]